MNYQVLDDGRAEPVRLCKAVAAIFENENNEHHMSIGTRDELGGAAYFMSVRKGIWRAKRKPWAFARELVKMTGDHRIFFWCGWLGNHPFHQ